MVTKVFSSPDELKMLQSLNVQQRAMLSLLEANFTQTVTYLTQERDSAIRDRDAHNQDAIATRQDSLRMQEQLTTYTRCVFVCFCIPTVFVMCLCDCTSHKSMLNSDQALTLT